MSAFEYSESLLAKQLGISRGRARNLRVHLEENLDWKKNGAEILLSQEGAARMRRLAGAADFAGSLEDCLAGPKKNGAPIKMTIVPPMPLNPRMVLAEDDGGERALVDVGKNATFCFGDVIEVAPHDVQEGMWRLVSEVPRDRRRLSR